MVPVRNPRVSVVIPSYNHAAFVGAAIQSVIAQTRRPHALLVIDDGSVDNSPQVIARELAAASFPCELIVRRNRGLSATLNEGLDRTSGDYFAYLSSDDLWAPDRLRRGIEALERDPATVMAFGAGTIIDAFGKILSTWGSNYHRAVLTVDDLLRFRSIPLSSTVTYRRSAVESIRWNETSPMEDYEMYLRLAASGRFVYIEEPLGSWRMHASNVSKDLPTMLHEALATQRRVASDIGVSDEELRSYAARVRFAYGGFFLQAHAWRQGALLTLENLSGTPSATALVRRLGRILVPPALVSARRALLDSLSRGIRRPLS